MRVVVQFHSQVEEDLNRWLVGTEPDDQNRRMLVRVYLDELSRVLQTTAGQPPDATRLSAAGPHRFRWQYTREAEITYIIRTEPARFLRSRETRIIVTAIRLELGP